MPEFPRTHTSGTTLSLPAVKAPMAPPPDIAPMDLSMPTVKAPSMPKGTTVTVKKPKPPSSNLRIKNGM